MDNIVLPVIEGISNKDVLTPEEYNYWTSRQNRTFYIDFEVDETYELMEIAKVIIQINMSEINIPKENLKPIYLFVHSYGGDIEQANFFCDLVMSSRVPIITIGMGVAMSAGFLILISGQKRYAFKHCQMLIHSGSAGFSGTAEQVEEMQKNYKKQINEMKEYILERTSIDEKTFNKNKNKDWYLTSKELIDYHVVDALIENIDDIL
mgnify:CR=1 FL=1